MSIRRVVTVAIAVVCSLVAAGAQEVLPVESISNWTAPPYWSPSLDVKVAKAPPGSPGTLGAEAVEVVPSPPMPFVAVNPCRIADTRGLGFSGQAGPPALTSNVTRTFQIGGTVTGVPTQCGIPLTAQAVSFQFTIIQPSAEGNLIAWPSGTAPTISVLNWAVGIFALGNGIVVPVSDTGGVNVFVNAAFGASAHLTIDVNGYYAPVGIVNTINGLFGAVTLAAGSNITITPAGQTLTIAAPNVDATSLGGQPASFYDQAPPPPSGNTITPLDTTGNVGAFTSVTIGADGLGLISYYDTTNAGLKVAHCSNTACTSATITPLDTAANVGQYTSVTIGADGLGLISYYDITNLDLKVAHCSNVNCTAATITPLDTAGSVGQFTSVTVGSDGLGFISYYDATNGNLKIAHCSNVNCDTAFFRSLNIVIPNPGQYTSVTIASDGWPLISSYDSTNGNLNVKHCFDLTCGGYAIADGIDSTGAVGLFTSVTIGADGLGLISYFDQTNGDLKVLHCSNINCNPATITPLDTALFVGEFTSVTIGADGLGLISYYDDDNSDLKVAHCSNVNCTAATTFAVDTTGVVGAYSSVTIGSDGFPLISYYDNTNGNLKVAHCSNAFCTPYLRRR
jgi:cell shape-determining protein MreC